MTLDREGRVEQIFHEALALDVAVREAFVVDACAGDEALRREVWSLLRQAAKADGFLSEPALVVAAQHLAAAPGGSLIGRKLGAYQIHSLLGAGGMGEVYRARDTKLGRDVAIKILPRLFVTDADRLARFEREARVLASLNHPHIGAIYGLEDVDGVSALVLELVEGPTLADRVVKGPLAVRDALAVAAQIAEALEAAHEKGIVHRDLKPANVVLTGDGRVKVLDFGLAKAGGGDASGPDLSQSPTITAGGTKDGSVLGTATYMSPEQARGKSVDKRTDIWAFGCVLYEMLTGRAAFPGATLTDTLAAVIEREPNWQALPSATPDKVRNVLRRCLQKDPQRRLRDIGDARIEIDEAVSAPVSADTGTAATGRRSGLRWIAVAAIAIVALALGFWIARRAEAPPEVSLLRTTILPPEHTAFDSNTSHCPAAVSPDGRRLTFCVRAADATYQLWLRPLNAVAAQPIEGTTGAQWPFWSPDSRFIAFFAGGKLKKIDASGGPATELANAPNENYGGTWNRDGVIVFAPEAGGSLYRVSASGGPLSPVTALDASRHEVSHAWPWFLPDGRHFLYRAESGPLNRAASIRLASLDPSDSRGDSPTTIVEAADSNARYAQGHVLFLRGDTLMAQPFDVTRLMTTGDALRAAERVPNSQGSYNGMFSVSGNGLLVYQAHAEAANEVVAWFDRSGKQITTLGDPGANLNILHLSPDRRSYGSIGIDDPVTRTSDIWIYNLAIGRRTRFTFDPASESSAVWSPDGLNLVFRSNRRGPGDLYRKPASGVSNEELLYADGLFKEPYSWSRDGTFLLYVVVDPKTKGDLWVMENPLGAADTQRRFPVVQTPDLELYGQFSPDGKWIAYMSNPSGRMEIFTVPFRGQTSDPGARRQISVAGGVFPRWRPDGKEIFYIAPDRQLMASSVTAAGDTLVIGAARPLFGPLIVGRGWLYDVSADGQRFLAGVPQPTDQFRPLTLVQNWTAGLSR